MSALDVTRIGRPVEYYATLDSTMRLAAERDFGAVVIADEQTAGQGRDGHSWHSEPGNGIYCSIVLPPTPLLTLALGLAARSAIATATGIECDLRWPNDLMLAGKKVGGILVQAVRGKAIAGIGINVNHEAFPPAIATDAISLRLHAGRRFAREEILAAFFPEVETLAAKDAETIRRLFAERSSSACGCRVVVEQPDGVVEGVTSGLDPSGFLIVRRDDGTDTLILAGGVRAAGTRRR